MINLESINESTNTLDTKYIKTSLSSDTMDNLIQKLDSNIETTKTIANAYKAHNLYKGTINGNSTKEFTLKLWMDYDTTKEQGASKTYSSKINVIANNDIEVDSSPEIKTTLANNTLNGVITGTASTIKYCTSSSNVCTPSTSASISNNKISITLSGEKKTKTVATILGNIEVNTDGKVMVCNSLNNKTYCSNSVEKSGTPDFSKISPTPIETETIINSKITNLTNITNDTTYPFTYDGANGTFTSTNKDDGTTSTVTFSPATNLENVSLCYEVSSEKNYDKAKFYVDDNQKGEVSGESSNCIELGNITTSNVIKTEYAKDSSSSSGNDEVIFYLTNDYEIKQTGGEGSGIYEAPDGMYGGTSYYWRGAVTDNHVIFANYCWRIIRINGDGTIRMIYNGAVQSGNTCLGNGANTTNVQLSNTSAFHADAYNNSTWVGWTYNDSGNGQQRPGTSINNGSIGTTNTIKSTVETWYNTNIGYTNSPYSKYVADGKYCNDRNTGAGGSTTTWSANGTAFWYAARTRLINSSPAPTLSCSNNGDIYQVKAALITADEVMYAGADGNYTANQSYYLYSNSWYWTMSPYIWSGSNALVFGVSASGDLNGSGVNGTGGVRPVINLTTDTLFESGSTGEASKPYKVTT